MLSSQTSSLSHIYLTARKQSSAVLPRETLSEFTRIEQGVSLLNQSCIVPLFGPNEDSHILSERKYLRSQREKYSSFRVSRIRRLSSPCQTTLRVVCWRRIALYGLSGSVEYVAPARCNLTVHSECLHNSNRVSISVWYCGF